ncbi:hypothetical protein PHYC_03026 [Phycisphaerales bacterium]|nr:hypothetical protein PHYC_03026 [Phycisphaerales bacterium]
MIADTTSSPASTPRSDPPAAPAPLPALSPREKALFLCLTQNNFDLPTLSQHPNFTADDLETLNTSPAVHAHLDSLFALSRRCLFLRAASARITSINQLEHAAIHSTDLIQKRLAANNLLRATAAPLIPVHDSPHEQTHHPRHPTTPHERTPAPSPAAPREHSPAAATRPPAHAPAPAPPATPPAHTHQPAAAAPVAHADYAPPQAPAADATRDPHARDPHPQDHIPSRTAPPRPAPVHPAASQLQEPAHHRRAHAPPSAANLIRRSGAPP